MQAMQALICSTDSLEDTLGTSEKTDWLKRLNVARKDAVEMIDSLQAKKLVIERCTPLLLAIYLRLVQHGALR